MILRVVRLLCLAAIVAPMLALVGCGGGGNHLTYQRSVALQWNTILREAISATRLGPPITARTIAVVHTCMFDAWAAYDARAVGTRLGGSLRRPEAERTEANKRKAVSFAAYRALVDLYPAEVARFNAKMAELGYDPNDVTTDTSTPAGIGNVAAAAVLEYRHRDGSNQLGDLNPGAYSDYTGYVPINTPDNVVDPSQWQQLRFANGATPGYIAPHWGNVIPFALQNPSQFRPPPPPDYGTPTYRVYVQQVVDFTANMTDERKVIAEYWADGPASVQPPGHWCIFADYISERDRYTLDQDVKMFFLLGNAVFDAGIACWDGKRAYNTSRPITAIRNLYAGQQIRTFLGPGVGFGMADGAAWLPYQSPNFITPPFPEYTSGHSTFSSASAEVLKRFTGSDDFGYAVNIPAGWATLDTNTPAQPLQLYWETFTEAAEEAGISRLYGGIHFLPANEEGRRCGRMVAEAVWNRGMEYINGTFVTP